MYKKSLLFFCLLFSQAALAVVPVDGMVSECSPYPELKNNSVMPLRFNTTNNLSVADKSGFYEAEGQKITVYGRVMDANCVPIGDAKILIWQANKAGYIQYEAKDVSKPKWVDPNFNGTGIVNTDNMGRFSFVTIMPGSSSKRYTPYINIKVEHPKLKNLYSKIFFAKKNVKRVRDKKSMKTSTISALVSAVPAVNKANSYYIDITMHQAVPYKEY